MQQAQLVDQVLQSFDAPTRRAFKQFVTGFGAALHDRGGDLNDAIGNAQPTAEDFDRLATILDRQRPALSSLVHDSGVSLQALAGRRDALQQLITAGDRVFSTTARRNRELTATVRAFPDFLDDLRTTLSDADGAVRDAAPVLRTVRPAAPQVRPALASASALAPRAERLARDLRPAVAELKPALPALTTILDRAGKLLGPLNAAGAQLVPVVQTATAYRREALALLANISSAANGTTGQRAPDGTLMHFVRAVPPVTAEQYFGFKRRLPSNRSNPYPRPGYWDDLAKPALQAFDCSHLSNPQSIPSSGSPPPCITQKPFSYPGSGSARSYPHLEPFPPLVVASLMEIILGSLLVLVGVMYGLHSHAGSEIGERPMKDELPDFGRGRAVRQLGARDALGAHAVGDQRGEAALVALADVGGEAAAQRAHQPGAISAPSTRARPAGRGRRAGSPRGRRARGRSRSSP